MLHNWYSCLFLCIRGVDLKENHVFISFNKERCNKTHQRQLQTSKHNPIYSKSLDEY